MSPDPTPTNFHTLAQNPRSTVVAEYTPDAERAEQYQSEDALEKAFIQQLQEQAYEYLPVKTETDLVTNLRARLEALNNLTFSDNEWNHFFSDQLANPSESIGDKTTTLQEDYVKNLVRDDGSAVNVRLLDKDNIHENSLQVINQYTTGEGRRPNRYDVTVLVNGLPLVHVELKRRGVAIREAFNQINRYQRESFWANSGLFEYVQLFVISNGTHTKYYSNTTRRAHLRSRRENRRVKVSDSFEFTSWWADARNKPIQDLTGFTRTFFAKHTLLSILTRYCVFTFDKSLLVMRPYQIAATEAILNRIAVSTNHKQLGTTAAGGYIWHTTGSGKTLTSFKTARLASQLDRVDKVLFVVDRKDLDYQTMREYDKFEKGAASSSTSTAKLQKQLENPDTKIIVTTIQKLARFIQKNKGHEIFRGHLVVIFDECHRSQFGDMHESIAKAFKQSHLFGFTGTPIFAKNASSGGKDHLKTTEQAFGTQLHSYTILDAIADKNVLRFKVDYISTMKEEEDIENKKISAVDREKALLDPRRIKNVVDYIRNHFDQKTKRNSHYRIEDRRQAGFNSILAVSSIDAAKAYYAEFQAQLQDVPSNQKLKVATIFSYSVNEDEEDGLLDENPEDTRGLDTPSRDFLDNAIGDYNAMFGTSFDTSPDKFQNYYKDLSLRVRNREVDLLIVVNMFLTGFDAKTLNTLWLDKNLRLHGLLQAYSRTNRILNSVKTFGNIVCFRNLEKATNESLALFADKNAGGTILLRPFEDYYRGYTKDEKEVRGYVSLVKQLQTQFPIGERITSETAQLEFVKIYSSILRLRNVLSSFDEFAEQDILTPRDIQDYHSLYIDLYHELRGAHQAERENINDDLVFEMELIKQVEINIDYVLQLIQAYQESHRKDGELLVSINKAIESSVELRNKKDLIHEFLASLEAQSDILEDWHSFVQQKKLEELDTLIAQENLRQDKTYAYVQSAFRNGRVVTTGTSLSEILPPLSRFSQDGNRSVKKQQVATKLQEFFEKYFDITDAEF